MIARPYQSRAIDGARQAYGQGAKSVVIVSPTGSGKTCMGAMVVQGHLARSESNRVVWLAHRSELLDQAAETLRGFGLEVGIRGESRSARVQIESVQTILARGSAPEGTLLVPDECHHFAESNRCGDITKLYPRILGLTATPERGDGKPLKPPFDAIVVAAQISELVAAGHLVPLKIKWPGKMLGKKHIAARPVDWSLEHARGLRAICFAPTLAAASAYRDDFLALGVRAGTVDGKMAKDVRAAVLSRHKSGDLDVLVNVGVLTEGYDDPAVSCVIVARGCGSQGLWLQMVGRALRPAPGKTEAILLDMRGITGELGRPDADRVFSLEGEAIKLATRDERNANRLCRSCHAPLGDLVVCPECGRETPLPVYAGLPAVDYEAVKEEARLASGASRMAISLAGMMRKAGVTQVDGRIGAMFRKFFKHHPRPATIAEANAYNARYRTAEANQRKTIEADARFNEQDESGWAVR